MAFSGAASYVGVCLHEIDNPEIRMAISEAVMILEILNIVVIFLMPCGTKVVDFNKKKAALRRLSVKNIESYFTLNKSSFSLVFTFTESTLRSSVCGPICWLRAKGYFTPLTSR